MKRLYQVIYLVAIAAFSVWLFYNEKLAEPGNLTKVHRESAECMDCHLTWKGVATDRCLQCHDFYDVSLLKPQIRFHAAGDRCMDCHTEHKGKNADISGMKHRILNEKLQCTQCHIDPHGGLFGEKCRECHRISTWHIRGFSHPSENSDCIRCHKAPLSHQIERFWQLITEGKFKDIQDVESSYRNECGRCHIPHRWDHLRMKHTISRENNLEK